MKRGEENDKEQRKMSEPEKPAAIATVFPIIDENFSLFKETLQPLWRAVTHYKRPILITSLAVSLLTYFNCKLQTPLYFSEATLLVEPITTGGEAGEILEFRLNRRFAEDELHTEKDVITSKVVAERIVQILELDKAGPFKNSKDPSQALRGLIQVNVGLKSRTLRVGVRFPDPVWAAKIAEGVIKAYIEVSEEKERSWIERAVNQMRGEITRIKNRLQLDQQRVKEYEIKHPNVISKEGLENELHHLTSELAQVSGERLKLRTELEELLAFQRQGFDVRDHPQVANDPSVAQIIGQLEEREVELTQLLKIYKEQFPIIIEKRAEIGQLKDILTERKGHLIEDLKSRYLLLAAREHQLRIAITKRSETLSSLLEEFAGYEALLGETEISKNLYSLILERMDKAAILTRASQVRVKVLNPPLVPRAPSWPNTRRQVLTAFLGSFFIASYGALLFLTLFKPIESEEEITEGVHIPVLVEIPYTNLAQTTQRENALIVDHGEGFSKDALRVLGTRIVAGNYRTILFTSARPSEGKTFLVRNLGVFLAREGWRVLLVGSDFRNLHLKHLMKIELNGCALENYLQGQCSEEKLYHPTSEPRLFYMGPGEVLKNSLEVITSPQFQSLIQNASQHFDFVLMDSPPLQLFSDGEMLAQTAKHVVIVIRSHQTPLQAVSKAVHRLEKAGVRVAGSVLNCKTFGWPRYYYYNYYYGYGERRGWLPAMIDEASQYVNGLMLFVERRLSPRVPATLPTEFIYQAPKGKKHHWKGLVTNLSEKGLFAEYWEEEFGHGVRPSDLDVLELKITLPEGEVIPAKGNIVKTSYLRGRVSLHIEFEEISEKDRAKLRNLVESSANLSTKSSQRRHDRHPKDA